MSETQRQILKHFLAALAYRTQKALKNAPSDFDNFRIRRGVRTPHELLHHMTGVLGYARTIFERSECHPSKCPTFQDEIRSFHEILASLGDHLDKGTAFGETTPERMLQGPFSDAMTHAGQLALLRRLHGHAVPPENFIVADISSTNLGPTQPEPVSPDEVWTEPE
jgi:hypothetical protein